MLLQRVSDAFVSGAQVGCGSCFGWLGLEKLS
jgi:hypothetical protein